MLMKSERNYEVPQVNVHYIQPEGALCSSGDTDLRKEMEELGENEGTWGDLIN